MGKTYSIKPQWFKRRDNLNYIISSWCEKKTDTEVHCFICDKTIFCSKKGFAAVIQHAKTEIHMKNASVKLSSNQLLLKPKESGNFTCSSFAPTEKNILLNSNTAFSSLSKPRSLSVLEPSTSSTSEPSTSSTSEPSTSSTSEPSISSISKLNPSSTSELSASSTSNNLKQLSLYNRRESAARAEIIWALKSVQSNFSPFACEDIKEVFNAMFPNAVPEQFSLGRTKLSYLITEALGPYFFDNLIADAKMSPYSLLFDETTNHADQKELQFSLRFWSEVHKEIVCHHLKTVFMGHATAEDIQKKIVSVLNESGLSMNSLIMLGSDGPRVNAKVWRMINQNLIEERGQGLIDIGTCNLHIVHNAFLKGVDEFGEVAKELIVDVYKFFKKYPSRWEDYESIQEKLRLGKYRFIKHTSTRWLTLGPAAERLLSQFPAVEDYFLKFIPKNCQGLMKSEKYKRISQSLKYVDIKVELKFLTESASLFEPFLKIFQKSEPLIHILHIEISDLLKKIAGRICKVDEINIRKVISDSQLLPIKDVYISKDINDLSVSLKDCDKICYKHKMQKHYRSIFDYLVDMTSLNSGKLLFYFKCFQPSEIIKPKSLNYASQIAKSMSFLGVNDLQVRDEFALLQSQLILTNYDPPKVRIDHFWRDIIYEKNSVGKIKYPALSIFVKASLSLSHGNSDVERGFSVSSRVLSHEKAAMSEKMLNARLNIRDGIRKYENVSTVPITKTLLALTYNSYNSYMTYLEEQKKAKEKKLKEAAEKEEEMKKSKIMKEEIGKKREGIDIMEKRAAVLSQKHEEMQSSADCLLKEGNERLKNAISKNDKTQIRIAQGLLEAAEQLRLKEREHEKETIKINKIVQKRKTNLIDYYSKSSKSPKI